MVSNQPITKRTVGEEVQTTVQDILSTVDKLKQGSVSINAPNFLSHYIESQYGRGFRKMGEALEQEFGSAPENSPHPTAQDFMISAGIQVRPMVWW